MIGPRWPPSLGEGQSSQLASSLVAVHRLLSTLEGRGQVFADAGARRAGSCGDTGCTQLES